ncbi:MAG: TolC family outer membrane protein, partial [Alphaproteobacteria bacterium]
MRRPLLGLLALIAGVTAMAPGVVGETLEEAMVTAYASNPTLLAQRAALRATDEGVSQALSGWRPTLSATGEIGKQDVTTESGFFTSDDVRTPETYSLNLSQPIFRGWRTVAETAEAENLVRADRAQLAEVEQDVLLQTATAYMDVLRDQAVLELAINNEQRLRRQLEAAQDRFDVGEVTRTDVAQAEARLSNAIADRIRARSDLTSARATYLNVVGVLPGKLSPPPDMVGLPDAERDAHEIAAEENPTILRAVYAERAARQEVRGAVGGLLPEVSLDADLRRAEDQASRGSLTESASLSARITIPLYQAGSA